MQELDFLENSSFRAFLAAVTTENFTEAARLAGMTQPGISQHIKKLETELGVDLFIRVGKSVHMTKKAVELREFIEKYRSETAILLESFADDINQLKGEINIGMPGSALTIPSIKQFIRTKAKNYPDIVLKTVLADSEGVQKRLLQGELDLGILTDTPTGRDLKYHPIYQEEYVLAGPKNKRWSKLTKDELFKLPFITFPGFSKLFALWSKAYFPKLKSRSIDQLNIIAEINGLHGVTDFLEAGIGCTILPRHVLDPLKVSIREKSSKAQLDVFLVHLKSIQNPLYRVRKIANAIAEREMFSQK